MQPTQNPTLDEIAGHCFGCGASNPEGLHLQFELTTDPATGFPVATAKVQLTRLHEGPPGYIHGGIIATLIDEAMSKLNRPLNALAMTRFMEIEYLRPSPLQTPLALVATHLSRSVNTDASPGRKLFHQAELRAQNGTVLARGKGLFVVIDPEVMEAALTRERARKAGP